jgi:hypothetical protein
MGNLGMHFSLAPKDAYLALLIVKKELLQTAKWELLLNFPPNCCANLHKLAESLGLP